MFGVLGDNRQMKNSLDFCFALTFVLLLAQPAAAHPYLPLQSGNTTVLAYDFHVDTTKPAFKQSDSKGKMIIRTEGAEEKQGKRYTRFRTSYEGISFMAGSKDIHVWRREENGVVYLASPLQAVFNETVELPADVAVGSEWDYFDGEKSKRKVTAHLELQFEGKKFPDCIEVTRSILNNEKLKQAINKNYYCRDVGEVGSLFKQPSPVGEYITETKLFEFKPANSDTDARNANELGLRESSKNEAPRPFSPTAEGRQPQRVLE